MRGRGIRRRNFTVLIQLGDFHESQAWHSNIDSRSSHSCAGCFGAGYILREIREDLFPIPEVAETELEQTLAFEALLNANIPDGHMLGEGKTITFGVLGQGSRGGISGTIYFWRNAFEAATGAELEIVEIPYNQLGTTIPADFLTEQYTYDVFIGASWHMATGLATAGSNRLTNGSAMSASPIGRRKTQRPLSAPCCSGAAKPTARRWTAMRSFCTIVTTS